MVYLAENWVSEYKKRGTYSVVETSTSEPDGELLRIIGYTPPEEFIFAPLRPEETGWCIGKSSPCWTGTENIINLVKGYEPTVEVKDLNKYPLFNESEISIVDGKMVINSLLTTYYAGISDDSDPLKRIIVSPNLDYEISFFVQVSTNLTPLTFSLKGYSENGLNVNMLVS